MPDNETTILAPQPTAKRLTLSQQSFLDSEEGRQARARLESMVTDPLFNTQDGFSLSTADNVLFVDKHMMYLSEHPKLSIDHYISNLRLKTRIR